jgi:peptide/nickel transport system ATP-binding protein
VSEVSLTLGKGETLGIAGESGCGKSTLAKLIMGLIPVTSGNILFRGTDISGLTANELTGFRKAVQIVFQDPFSSLNPRMRVREIIAEPLQIHGLVARDELQTQVNRLMKETGLDPEHGNRYPHEFSGGQRQRIGIARALAVAPLALIADEPVSALDLSIQAQIINLFMELKQTRGLSLVFIAHDLSVVRHVSDRIAVMYLGRIVEIGPGNNVFTQFLHPYTEALISAVPQIRPVAGKKRIVLAGDVPSPLAIPQGCPFNSRCPYAREKCRRERPPLEEKRPGHMAACHYSKEIFS